MTNMLIFDLDGTLVDTPSAIVEAFTATFANLGVEPKDASAIRATIGLPLNQAFGKLLGAPTDDPTVIRAAQRYQVLFKEHVLPTAKRLLFPGVADGLTALQRQGFTLAVATSKFSANAEGLLTAAGIQDRFALVVGADQVDRPKPHPEMGHLIIRKLGIPPERAIMVGDTTHDLLMAKAVGMRSIAVTYGVHSLQELTSADPTWVVDTFDAVRKRVEWAARDDQQGAAAASASSVRLPRRQPSDRSLHTG